MKRHANRTSYGTAPHQVPYLTAVLVALGATFAACGGKEPPPAEYPPIEAPESSAFDEEQVDPALAEEPKPAEPPPADIRVEGASRTPLEGKAPKVRFVPARSGKTFKNDVTFRLSVTRWKTEEGGKHIHLIVDNEPYIAIYDTKKALNINELVKEKLGHELSPGTHVLRAFPGRPHHESVKEGEPFAMLLFHYKEKSENFAFDPKAPLLTYSRPKDCVKAGEPALLDFYVTNAQLSNSGVRVEYDVDGRAAGKIFEWNPHYITNLPEGTRQISLKLVDASGELVPGMYNSTTRSVEVTDACASSPKPSVEDASETSSVGDFEESNEAEE